MVVWATATITGTAPSCVDPNYSQYMSFDTNTEAGRAIFRLATEARASGGYLTVTGTGTCGHYSIIEEWYYGTWA
jgi:hypothetical protein